MNSLIPNQVKPTEIEVAQVPDINPLHAKAIAKEQVAKNLNTQLGSEGFEETITLGSGNDNLFPHALDD